MKRPPPPPPEAIEGLRRALELGAIDPKRVYRCDVGDGQVFEWTGAQLLETAVAFLALLDANEREDDQAVIKALDRINRI